MSLSIKALLDILMAILFFLLMADRHTGNALHEWLGVVLAGVVPIHIWLNRGWCKRLGKGRYDGVRVARLLLNMLLLLAVMGTLTSAVLISRTIFSFSGFRGELVSRTAHVCCAHWSFFLAAAHLGIYGKRLNAALRPHLRFPYPRWRGWASPIPGLVLVAYGVYVVLHRELLYPLTMGSAFMVWNENDNAAIFFLDYGVLFFLCAWAASAVSRLARKGKIRPGAC